MKEFKSIEEQVELLKGRGVITDESTATILLRENYYSVVNGYKDPFLDRTAMQSCPNEVYLPETRFEWLYSLFLFDRELRQLTFGYLIQAEAALKTATVYAFCDAHRGCTDYLDRASFSDAKGMLVPKAFRGNKAALHSNNMNRLMKILNDKLVSKAANRPFTAHYLQRYGEVPLWVLCNDLTFGNMSHFYQLMKRGEQNSVCKHLFSTTLRTDEDERLSPHDVMRAYDVLVHFRNLCAHDERLYCARKDNDTYATMLELLRIALPAETVEGLKRELEGLLKKYENSLHVVTADDLGAMLGLPPREKPGIIKSSCQAE
ncbi:Abi family protein [Adlercreutzia sp. ZJ473]|uniref:Abi family protein n=1 Tax=Adlercreutzia sp. ZJ473 TaxID=2722822 RepID=UPI001557B00B|nr:Abi family protein [Adlercreutzia sp. ZJ473]